MSALFHPLIQRWFEERFSTPTAAQREGWAASAESGQRPGQRCDDSVVRDRRPALDAFPVEPPVLLEEQRVVLALALLPEAHPPPCGAHGVDDDGVRRVGDRLTLLQQGGSGGYGPKLSGLTVVGYLYREGYDGGNLGVAAAVGWVLTLIILGINLVQIKLSATMRSE